MQVAAPALLVGEEGLEVGALAVVGQGGIQIAQVGDQGERGRARRRPDDQQADRPVARGGHPGRRGRRRRWRPGCGRCRRPAPSPRLSTAAQASTGWRHPRRLSPGEASSRSPASLSPFGADVDARRKRRPGRGRRPTRAPDTAGTRVSLAGDAEQMRRAPPSVFSQPESSPSLLLACSSERGGDVRGTASVRNNPGVSFTPLAVRSRSMWSTSPTPSRKYAKKKVNQYSSSVGLNVSCATESCQRITARFERGNFRCTSISSVNHRRLSWITTLSTNSLSNKHRAKHHSFTSASFTSMRRILCLSAVFFARSAD